MVWLTRGGVNGTNLIRTPCSRVFRRIVCLVRLAIASHPLAAMSWRNPRLLLPLAVLLSAGVGFAVYRIVGARDAELAAADRAIARRNFKIALQHLDRYLATHPDDGDARLLAAQSARRNGDFESAGKHLRMCRPDAAALEQQLLRVQQGNLPAALSLLEKYSARRDDPNTPLVLEAAILGTLRGLGPARPANDFQEEEKELLAAAGKGTELWLELRKSAVDQSAGLTWRGRLRCLQGDFDQGLADLRRAIELDPESFEARFHFAALAGQREPVESLQHLEHLLAADPKNREVRFGLAGGYRQVGKLDDAAALLRELLEEDKDNVAYLIARGRLALDQSRPAEGEPFLTRAVSLAPNDPQAHLALGQCLDLLGQTDKAREHREKYEQLAAMRRAALPPP